MRKTWHQQQFEKGYLTWQEYMAAVKEDELVHATERAISAQAAHPLQPQA